MSTERVVSDLHDIILLYLAAMVEIDHLLLTPQRLPDDEEFNNNDNDDNTMEDLIAITNKPTTTHEMKKIHPNLSNLTRWDC